MKNVKWFELGIPQVERKLKTNAASGLSRKAARSRINREAGCVFLLPRKSAWTCIGEIFFDASLLILLLTSLVSLCFADGQMSAAVVLVLLGCSLLILGTLSYRAQRQLEHTLAAFVPTVHVIRGGRLFCVDPRSVVVGDVILVEEGDVLACDARIVNSDSLRVRMRLDRQKEVVLDKKADGFVDPRERRASEMINMLHAGSVVEQGSARAIVTAVGKYTYIGAMTGGIEIPMNQRQPEILRTIQKQSMSLSLGMLLAVLPFTLLSLLFNKLNGGNALLSVSFLSAIALCATTLSPFSTRWLRFFYTHRMRAMRKGAYAMQVASMDAVDKLSRADYLFVTDGCAMTDGILHPIAMATAEGEVRSATGRGSAKYLCELISLYHTAATGSMTTGVSGSGEYLPPMRELIARCRVDEGALRIRCSILSYLPADLSTSFEYVSFTDGGASRMLGVSCSHRVLSECDSVMLDGVKQVLTPDLRARLERMWADYAKRTRAPMIFTVSDPRLAGRPCFVGMVALREGVDPKLTEQIERIEKAGCRVISFVPTNPMAPRLPDALLAKGGVSKSDLKRNGLPLTHDFGKIRVYSEFEREDILSLLKYARARGQRVMVLGFGEDAATFAGSAEGLLTCSPLGQLVSQNEEHELASAELAGRQYSVSCTQEQKAHAGYLFERPSRSRGGLKALLGAISGAKHTAESVAAFWQYLVWAHFLRLLIVAFPMLFGHTILDARHVLFFASVMDAFAFAIFLFGSYRFVGFRRRVESTQTVLSYLLFDRATLIASLSASVACFLLPQLLGLTGWVDRYIYRTEFTFLALMALQLILLISLLGDRRDREMSLWKNGWLLGEIAFLLLFVLACALWQPFGDLFGWEKNPLPYVLLSIVPSGVFVLARMLLRRIDRRAPKN